jgi:hypothetical protein
MLLAVTFSNAFPQSGFRVDKLFKQIATQDSGFLQKREALQILSMAGVLDSTNIENEQWIEESDTIAKYYKNGNGNYIISIESGFYGYYEKSNILIEFSPQGKVLNKKIYYHCYCCSPCGNFNKFGDFFCLEIYSCGEGGYAETDLLLFKEIAPMDSLKFIPFSCWTGETGYEDTIEHKHSNLTSIGIIKKVENDSLIISYSSEETFFVFIGEGRDIEEKVVEIKKQEPFDVLYIYKDNAWHFADEKDYEKFNTTCFYFF